MKTENLNPEIATLQTNLLSLTSKEDSIFLENCPVDLVKGSLSIFAFHSHIRLNNMPVNGAIPAEVIEDNTKFADLFAEVMKLYNQQANYITGVRIILGVNPDFTKIVLGYKPLLMVKGEVLTATPSTKMNCYNIAKEGPIFIYAYDPDAKEKKFVPAPEDYTQYIQNYVDKIDIRRHDIEIDPTDYIPNVDTGSVIFSFQEIFSMIDDNAPEKKTLIFNCMVSDHEHVATKRNSLIMSPNIYPTTFEKARTTFKNMYSDLAHLCPPNCTSLKYKLKA